MGEIRHFLPIDDMDAAEQANLYAWQARIGRRWDTYWARRGRGLGAPFPNTGGWRRPTWQRYWFVSWRVGDGWKTLRLSSRGAARRALRHARNRGRLDAEIWWCEQGVDSKMFAGRRGPAA